jgi:hypothetical protein
MNNPIAGWCQEARLIVHRWLSQTGNPQRFLLYWDALDEISRLKKEAGLPGLWS